MKRSLYLAIAAGVLLSACSKKDGMTYAERRAVGQYKFEKVVVHDGLRSTNVTQDYNNMILQLNNVKEAALVDQNAGVTYLGKYDIIEQTGTTTTDDDGNTTTNTDYTIIIDIKSPGRGNSYHWVGKNASFGSKMRFDAEKADGRYSFRLDKI